MHDRNLCRTVESRTIYATVRCSVPRLKVTPLYARLAAEDGNTKHIWDYAHMWSDHAGGLKGGRCERCGLTLAQCRVRINPKTGQPVRSGASLARLIAATPADVPPVHFGRAA